MSTNLNTIEVSEVEESDTDLRMSTLAAYLGIDAEDVSEVSYGDNTFDADGAEYLVLTNDEADERAAEYIKDSLWAFNASFLAGYTNLPEEVFTAMQDQCESANDTFYTLISRADGGIEGLIEEAISADGRGHFMSSYDGEENEEGEWFIYRTN